MSRFTTPLMLAVTTSASVALTIPLAPLGTVWAGLTAGLLGGGSAFLYVVRQIRRRDRGPYCKLCWDYGCPNPHTDRPEELLILDPPKGQATGQPEAHPSICRCGGTLTATPDYLSGTVWRCAAGHRYAKEN